MRIVFHGTRSVKARDAILRNGFLRGTYFAAHLEDALCYGGNWIFEVALDEPIPRNWQFRTNIPIVSDKIVSLREYTIFSMRENTELRATVFAESKAGDL